MGQRRDIVEGVQLVPKELSFPVISFLSDKERLAKYKERIVRYGKRAKKTLDIFYFKDNVIKGSNPFANVELASDNLVLPSELEHAVRINPGYFNGTYSDIVLVQRTEGDSISQNDYVARQLAKQIKRRNTKFPVRISLKGLTLKEDRDSAYGLVFIISDETEVIHVPEFAYENSGKRFSKTDEQGIPIFSEDATRKFYARKDGLSRLRFDLVLSSSDWALADSCDYGRLVVKV